MGTARHPAAGRRRYTKCAFALALAWAVACGHELHDDYGTGADSSIDAAASAGDASTVTGSSAGTSLTTSLTTSADATTGPTSCDLHQPRVCDPFAQDCCDGFKCAPLDEGDGDDYWDAMRCVALTGEGQHGAPCVAADGYFSEDTCAIGHVCLLLDDDGAGTCLALCQGDSVSPVCDHVPDATCVGSGGFWFCAPSCDPLLQDCPSEQVCVPASTPGEGFICVIAAESPQPEGSGCEFNSDCALGLVCAPFDLYPSCTDSRCCAPYCDLDEDAACEDLSLSDAACLPWYEPGDAPAGLEKVGVCGPPP